MDGNWMRECGREIEWRWRRRNETNRASGAKRSDGNGGKCPSGTELEREHGGDKLPGGPGDDEWGAVFECGDADRDFVYRHWCYQRNEIFLCSGGEQFGRDEPELRRGECDAGRIGECAASTDWVGGNGRK